MIDIVGPFAFYPDHCFPVQDERNRKGAENIKFNSPVIAYIKTGSSIEDDIIDQLESLFLF